MAAASLGSATGSRVDSAAKHTMACKVDTRYFKGTIENFEDCDNVLKGSRDKYAMQKDEIVMNTSKRLHAASGHTAYPLVITTLGDLNQSITRYLKEIYGSQSATQFIDRSSKDFKDAFARDIPPERNADKKVFEVVAAAMPEFRCQGVALGQAFASHLTGDTVATVLVGGMVTVMNGHFEMFAGDDVQWYFDFEKDDFYSDSNDVGCQGERKQAADNDRMPVSKKMRFNEHRLMGSQPGIGVTGGLKSSGSIFRIKSYHPVGVAVSRQRIMTTHYGDKIRVFAKCIIGGRAGDQVDLMILTQSS